MRRYMWQGIEHPSMEFLTLIPGDYGAHASSQIVGLWNGQPYHVAYTVEYSLLGEVSRVIWDTGELVSREPGWWVDEDGRDCPQFEQCRTVDIRQTPFTNTLAILYAELGTGMSLEFPVIQLDLVGSERIVAAQRYAALGWKPDGARYRFQQDEFEVDLVVDAESVVIEYPGLFKRIFP